MSVQVFQVSVEVDDEALADWIPESETKGGPYTKDFSEWDASDLFRSADHEIVMPSESDITYLGPATNKT